MSTIKQVAERAGVSQATVSRVMNGEVRVAEATRQRVDEAMQALGYRPNSFARSLASNRSNGIGLVISHLAGAFMGRLMTSLEERMRRQDKSLLVASGHSEATCEREAIDFLLSRRCDGLLVHADVLSDEALEALGAQVPIVIVNRVVPALIDRCAHVDNVQGGYRATRHLIELGHRRIACITGPLWKQDATQRLMGYRRAMAEAGLPVDSDAIVEGDSQLPSGRHAIEVLRGREVAFTALVVGSDDMAIGAMQQLREVGLRVPEDVSLVGYDDEAYADFVTPGLTTIHVPVEEMAQAAAGRLLALTYGHAWEGRMQFPVELVERGTTAPPPGEPPGAGRL